MPDASAACSKSGVLEKNHKGAPFAKGSQKRFFSSDGFHVSYYTDASMRKCTGSFDLRNVVVRLAYSQHGSREAYVEELAALKDAEKEKKRKSGGAPTERKAKKGQTLRDREPW